jgi:hypothetical protein
MNKDKYIQDAGLFLYVYSNEVIDLMKTVNAIGKDNHKLTAADPSKIKEAIKQIALAQSALRKVREIATRSIA